MSTTTASKIRPSENACVASFNSTLREAIVSIMLTQAEEAQSSAAAARGKFKTEHEASSSAEEGTTTKYSGRGDDWAFGRSEEHTVPVGRQHSRALNAGTSMFWCAVAVGGVLQGRPLESVSVGHPNRLRPTTAWIIGV